MKRFKKTFPVFVLMLGLVIGVPIFVVFSIEVYHTLNQGDSIPFTLLNDTDRTVEVTACAGDGPRPPMEPGKSDTYYAYPSDAQAACGLYDKETDTYLGCLPTPVKENEKSTFLVSNASLAVKHNDCGLERN